jgi:DHA1 family bicyclomycin/chloramphenicol resistance-like MFS transporter
MNASGKTNIQVPLWLLLLIAFTGTLAMHIFVPALPLAQTTLDASSHQIQMTITVYVIGLAVGQLIYGPISDAIGRRPAVFAGLLIFLLGSIGAAFAQTLPSMVTARLIQGLGGAGGLSLARAMVKDGAGDKNATKKLALMNLILLIGPGIAPVIGSLISSQLGWRYIFYALSVLGGAGLKAP